MKKKFSSAFTFIELAIVISVIAVLVSVVIYGANSLISIGNINRARAITASSPVRDIDGLVAWYETSTKNSFKAEETIDEGGITEWHDISPYSVDNQANILARVGGTGITYVKDGINGVPSLRFTPGSAATRLTITSFAQGSSTQSTMFVVYSRSNNGVVTDNGDWASSGCNERSMSGSVGFWTGTGSTSPSFTVTIGLNYIVAVNYNASNPMAYLNNVTGSTFVMGTPTRSLCGITVGGYQGATTAGFDGLISEVIVFNRILNLNERKAVMSYLSKKYKIYVNGV